MNRVFGEKQDAVYYDRKGAYLIPSEGSRIAVVRTKRGYFLLGGGIENCETDIECIKRECLEEIGYTVVVQEYLCSAEAYTKHSRLGHFHPMQHYYRGRLLRQVQEAVEPDHHLIWAEYSELKNRMFSEMQNWALDQFVSTSSFR